MSRSSNAARYGALAERVARRRYGLEAAHDSWHDAETADGQPVEVKSCMLNRASGQTGRFRVFKKYHKKLQDENGIYVFIAYRAVGRGIQPRKVRTLEADALGVDWYGAGGHRDSAQAKIPPGEVF